MLYSAILNVAVVILAIAFFVAEGITGRSVGKLWGVLPLLFSMAVLAGGLNKLLKDLVKKRQARCDASGPDDARSGGDAELSTLKISFEVPVYAATLYLTALVLMAVFFFLEKFSGRQVGTLWLVPASLCLFGMIGQMFRPKMIEASDKRQ